MRHVLLSAGAWFSLHTRRQKEYLIELIESAEIEWHHTWVVQRGETGQRETVAETSKSIGDTDKKRNTARAS
jgi:hypothetical protein